MDAPVGIRIVDDCVTDCPAIIEYLIEQTGWNSSGIRTGEVDSSIRKSKTFSIPMMSWRNPPIIHEMNRKVFFELDKYASDFEFGFSNVEDVSVQRYEVGDYYKPHTDAGTFAPRVVSAVLYLNTVEKGGGTRFTLFDYEVTPIAGRLAIFPSDYVYKHEALPPEEGIKIAAAYWARF